MKNINELAELFPSLAVFIQVVEKGSFSSAGRALSMAPSSVSRMIDRLEKRLSVILFTRTTRAVQVTEAGQEIYQQALSVISVTSALLSQAGSYSDKPQGLLRITAPNTLGKILLTPFMSDFLLRYPDINVELLLTDRVINMTHDPFDLAVRVTESPPENMVARALMPIEYILVCASDYRADPPLEPDELHRHNIFFPDERQFRGEWLFMRGEDEERVLLTPRLMINNSDAMLDAILQGIGIALIPTFIADIYLHNGKVRRVLPEWRINNPLPRTAYAITLPNRLLPLKTRVFIDDFMAWLKARDI
ncbi:LysR family transcriptional regulator [Enterobacillus tribolii]|uniref:LysR family transcriptional regulator n=1 Tax=Enterobacillus tribolii TaxID=1487935 RepID=UPI000E1E0F0A|nr:LysR family transcriptional regulator [Enterobacillus tribolii]MBW7981943.1 LysR family transcriptional regulator [Enterobacillus tribolii]